MRLFRAKMVLHKNKKSKLTFVTLFSYFNSRSGFSSERNAPKCGNSKIKVYFKDLNRTAYLRFDQVNTNIMM